MTYKVSLGQIPDGEILYRYIRPDALPAGQTEVPDSILQDKNLSCDWKKFQEQPETSPQVTQHGKTVILAIKICDDIRNPLNDSGDIQFPQDIRHSPTPSEETPEEAENYAHSLISGRKKLPVT